MKYIDTITSNKKSTIKNNCPRLFCEDWTKKDVNTIKYNCGAVIGCRDITCEECWNQEIYKENLHDRMTEIIENAKALEFKSVKIKTMSELKDGDEIKYRELNLNKVVVCRGLEKLMGNYGGVDISLYTEDMKCIVDTDYDIAQVVRNGVLVYDRSEIEKDNEELESPTKDIDNLIKKINEFKRKWLNE